MCNKVNKTVVLDLWISLYARNKSGPQTCLFTELAFQLKRSLIIKEN